MRNVQKAFFRVILLELSEEFDSFRVKASWPRSFCTSLLSLIRVAAVGVDALVVEFPLSLGVENPIDSRENAPGDPEKHEEP